MPRRDDQVAGLAKALSANGGLKLWSVIVTVLGDLAEGGEDEVPGVVLSQLIERIGLQREAMRVALHRLKRDGWVESRRDGRIGYHRLSVTGRAQTGAVTGRVYGSGETAARGWRLAVVPPDQAGVLDEIPEDWPVLPLSRRAAVVAAGGGPDLPADWLMAEIAEGSWPRWAEELVEAEACEAEFTGFLGLLAALDIDAVQADPFERLALRVLVLHGWRRLALRSNPVAESILGADCAAARCRRKVLQMLRDLPRPDLSGLEPGNSGG